MIYSRCIDRRIHGLGAKTFFSRNNRRTTPTAVLKILLNLPALLLLIIGEARVAQFRMEKFNVVPGVAQNGNFVVCRRTNIKHVGILNMLDQNSQGEKRAMEIHRRIESDD